jgi:hypothetical protein
MASDTYQGTDLGSDPQNRDDHSSADSAIGVILPENTKNAIITKAPEERFRLGYWDVIALVVNRVIGLCLYPSLNLRLMGQSQALESSILRRRLCVGRKAWALLSFSGLPAPCIRLLVLT